MQNVIALTNYDGEGDLSYTILPWHSIAKIEIRSPFGIGSEDWKPKTILLFLTSGETITVEEENMVHDLADQLRFDNFQLAR